MPRTGSRYYRCRVAISSSPRASSLLRWSPRIKSPSFHYRRIRCAPHYVSSSFRSLMMAEVTEIIFAYCCVFDDKLIAIDIFHKSLLIISRPSSTASHTALRRAVAGCVPSRYRDAQREVTESEIYESIIDYFHFHYTLLLASLLVVIILKTLHDDLLSAAERSSPAPYF